MKNFAILGVGGYIAPRHIQAISDTGNRVVCAMDINDSVGILDRYTQDVSFFTDFERFEAYLESLKGTDRQIDVISICSPNYLHCSHMKFALRHGCDVICEKPLVLESRDLNELRNYEDKFGGRVNTVLQLRVHDSIIQLKNKIETSAQEKHDVNLTYLTSRGPWYHESWKGKQYKSGGLASNIGVHFFDMLTWIFGDVVKNELHVKNDLMNAGVLELEKASVKWILSVDRRYLPEKAIEEGRTTYRSIIVDGEEVEFSGGFTDLHTRVYEGVLAGQGYGLDENRQAIRLVEQIRQSLPVGVQETSHDILKGL